MPITPELKDKLVEVVLKRGKRDWGMMDFVDEAKFVRDENSNLNIPYEDIFPVAREAYDKCQATAMKPAPEAKAKAAPAETDGALPELLPFSKLPGYLLDPWGVPHRQVGQGRKAGKVLPDNRLFNKKGRGKPQHMWRYRLTIDGARRDYYPRYLAMARLLAEKEWKSQSGDNLDDSTQKVPPNVY